MHYRNEYVMTLANSPSPSNGTSTLQEHFNSAQAAINEVSQSSALLMWVFGITPSCGIWIISNQWHRRGSSRL